MLNLPNGVYAVAADGSPVYQTSADATCIGVALLTDNQKIMIEKKGECNTTSIKAAYTADGATNTDYTEFYRGSKGTDVSDIKNSEGNTAAKADFNAPYKLNNRIPKTRKDEKRKYETEATVSGFRGNARN